MAAIVAICGEPVNPDRPTLACDWLMKVLPCWLLLLNAFRPSAICCPPKLVVPGSCTGEWREHKHNPTGAGPAVLASRQSRFGDSNLPGPRRDPLHTHSFALYLHS
eukprot:scpid43688/ scgid15642/ 